MNREDYSCYVALHVRVAVEPYKHHCLASVFLGQIKENGKRFDLYYNRASTEIFRRFGDGKEEFSSVSYKQAKDLQLPTYNAITGVIDAMNAQGDFEKMEKLFKKGALRTVADAAIDLRDLEALVEIACAD